ncbi:transglycosylase SLT domain-containing protein [Streptomyces sp. NPDC051320]|uniref:transglycosylase SLT domain-containing protein n=1 Tax=Streptomyces sp. NPDC051320 TaxID=3154644 RepID=UPI00341253C5
MPRFTTFRITRSHKIATAVLVSAGAATALTATAAPSSAHTTTAAASTVQPVKANGLPTTVKPVTSNITQAKDTAKDTTKTAKIVDASSVSDHLKLTVMAQSKAAKHAAKQAANRSTHRKALAPKHYTNNLDGWIRQSLAIMKAKGIPGTYEGLHRNIMRESSGNPNAVNDWDINAINGIPSKGLLQVIQPTFDTYHVAGTADKLTDPVANITAAANYAAHRYGSIDNVNSAY